MFTNNAGVVTNVAAGHSLANARVLSIQLQRYTAAMYFCLELSAATASGARAGSGPLPGEMGGEARRGRSRYKWMSIE